MFDVEGLNFVELVGVNIAVSECEPLLRTLMGPTAMPPATGAGLPRLVVPSLNCTVPVALGGTTVAVAIAKPPSPKGSGTWITLSVVVVTVTPDAGVGVGVGLGVGLGVGVGLGDGVGVGLAVGGGAGLGVGAGVGMVLAGVIAMPCGLVPVGMGLPGVLVATVIGVTVLLPWLVT